MLKRIRFKDIFAIVIIVGVLYVVGSLMIHAPLPPYTEKPIETKSAE